MRVKTEWLYTARMKRNTVSIKVLWMSRLLLFICIHLYSVLLEIIRIILSLLQGVHKRSARWHLRERSVIPVGKFDCHADTIIWIHAASLGEAKVVYKFLAILEDKNPDHKYILTAVTETGVTYLRSHKKDSVCAVRFLPLDTVGRMQRMLDYYSVSRVWLMETEIWPGMLWACRKKKVPVGVFNARIEKKSFKLYHRFLLLLKPLFAHFDIILAQDKEYANRYKKMGARSEVIHVTGNVKSQIVIRPPKSEQRNTLRQALNLQPENTVITVGCVHPGEAKIIRETIDICTKKGLQWKWIIIPRHLNKTQIILEELGNSTVHCSKAELSGDWDICCIEKMGILEDMYMIADFAVLGGTFIDVGGHNIWEAVQFGIPVFFGPDYYTQQASCARVLKAGTGFCVKDAHELAEGLITVIQKEESRFSDAMAAFIETVNKKATTLESYIP